MAASALILKIVSPNIELELALYAISQYGHQRGILN